MIESEPFKAILKFVVEPIQHILNLFRCKPDKNKSASIQFIPFQFKASFRITPTSDSFGLVIRFQILCTTSALLDLFHVYLGTQFSLKYAASTSSILKKRILLF